MVQRKRKLGIRQPNGRLRAPSKAEREANERKLYEVEMLVVRSQPHRRGSIDPRCESALGRFSMNNPKLRRELFDAADDYAGLKRRWRAAKGAPSTLRLVSPGTGEGPSDATVRAWERQIAEIEQAAAKESPFGFAPMLGLILDDRDVLPGQTIAVIYALDAVAVATGWLGAKARPY